jgi:hypothetical protein
MEPLESDERDRDEELVSAPVCMGTAFVLISLVMPEGPREGLFLVGCFLLGFSAGFLGPAVTRGTRGGGRR